MLGQAPALLHRHAHAGVLHLHDHPARGLRGGPDGQGPAPGHGVHRVVDEAHEGVAQLEGIALDGRQGLHVLGHRDDGALAIRLVAPARRGQLEGLRDHRGQAHRPVGGLGLARNKLLQLTDRRGRLERHVTDHHEPPARGLRLALAQHQLGVGEDGGQRVVEVVREAAHGLPERAQVLVAGEPAGRLRETPAEVARPAPHGEHRAVHLHLGAADLARDVLDLFVVGEEERVGHRLARIAPHPPAHVLPDALDHGERTRGSRAAPPARDDGWRRRT